MEESNPLPSSPPEAEAKTPTSEEDIKRPSEGLHSMTQGKEGGSAYSSLSDILAVDVVVVLLRIELLGIR